MTKKEYQEICDILDKYTQPIWVTPYYCKRYIPSESIPTVKSEIEKLIKGDK